MTKQEKIARLEQEKDRLWDAIYRNPNYMENGEYALGELRRVTEELRQLKFGRKGEHGSD